MTLDSTITYVNPRVYDITNYKPEELIGKSCFDFIHPDERLSVRKKIEVAVKNRTFVSMEFRIRHKDGHYIPVYTKGSMARLDGELKIIAVLRDISDLKEAEQKLSEYVDKYNNIIQNTSDMIVEVDMKGRITDISPQVEDITGVKPAWIIGKKWFNYAVSDVENQKKMLNPREDVNNLAFEYKTAHADRSELWLDIKGRRFVDKDGNKKDLIIARDITEKKIARQQLKEAFERENFYKDLFTHDINNILQIIQSSVSLLTLFQDNPEVQQEEIKDIINLLSGQVIRGSRLVSNVRRLSELEHQEISLGSIEASSVLENAIKFVQEGYQDKEITIHVNNRNSNVQVQANALLQDVFENILINAVKYTNDPSVSIDIHISEEYNNEKKYGKFEFMDNGIGIADSRKEIIFQEGNRKDKSIKGMGFGLSLVKKIMKSYGGKIWVEDRIEGDYSNGSNFIILVPSAKSQAVKEISQG